MRKKILIITLIALLSLILFTGCEEEDGNIYLSIWYTSYSDSISISGGLTAFLPNPFYTYPTYYQATAGTYTGQYRLEDDSFFYYYNYAVTMSAEAGDDRYYDMDCYFGSYDFYYATGMEMEFNNTGSTQLEEIDPSKLEVPDEVIKKITISDDGLFKVEIEYIGRISK